MALEQKQQILKQRIQLLHCDHCSKPLKKNGFFYAINENEFHYFDTQKCRTKFKDGLKNMYPEIFVTTKKPKRKTTTVRCTNCTKEFEVFESKYKHAVRNYNGHIYCSRNCSKLNHHRFYDNFFFCDFCRCWIKQDDAIWIERKTQKMNKTIALCPKPSCNGNKLKTRSTNYKQKQQEQSAAEEEQEQEPREQ